jgi:hypothetical protein
VWQHFKAVHALFAVFRGYSQGKYCSRVSMYSLALLFEKNHATIVMYYNRSEKLILYFDKSFAVIARIVCKRVSI